MTFMQAFKVWWSYSWRASILVIPISLIMLIWSLAGILPTLENMVQSGQSPTAMNVDQLLRLATGGTTMMILSMVVIAVVQVFAMRWTLNSRWSDFRLKAVPPDAETQSNAGPGSPSRPASI